MLHGNRTLGQLMRSSVVKNRDGISPPLRVERSSCFVGVNGGQSQLSVSSKAAMNVTQPLTASYTEGDCYTVVPLVLDIPRWSLYKPML